MGLISRCDGRYVRTEVYLEGFGDYSILYHTETSPSFLCLGLTGAWNWSHSVTSHKMLYRKEIQGYRLWEYF